MLSPTRECNERMKDGKERIKVLNIPRARNVPASNDSQLCLRSTSKDDGS